MSIHKRNVLFCLALLYAWPLHTWAISQEAYEAIHYHLEVAYEAPRRTIRGQVSVSAIWRGLQPLTAVYFFLPPNTLSRPDPREPAAFRDLRYARGFTAARLRVQQVHDAAKQGLPFQLQDDPAMPVGRVPDQAILQVSLPRPYQLGERFALTVTFTTRLPEAKNWGVYRGHVALDGYWYPMLVPYRQGRWLWGLQEFVHAHYTLRLTTDAAQQVVASVPWDTRTSDNGQQTFSGSAGPLYHLGLSSHTQWHRETDAAHTPVLQVVVPPGERSRAAFLLQTLRNVLGFYRQQFGLIFPGAVLTVVVHERDQSWPLSASADHVLFLSRDLVRVPDLIHKLVAYFVARGVAQQWWGLRVAYNLHTERWIGEGLTTYLAFRWLDQEYGPGRNFLTWKGAWLPNFSYREQTLDITYRYLAVREDDPHMRTPLSEAQDRLELRFLYEKKGALVYSMLHNLLGAEVFQDFLHFLLTENSGAVVSTPEVQRAAETVSGRELDWFFRQWVEQRVKLDYAVGRVEAMPQTEPQGRTVYVNRVEIQRLGEAVMPLTVRLLATDGSVYETQLSGVAPHQTVTWQATAPLSDVQLDPAHRLPDVQPLNNTARLPYAVRPLIDFPRLDAYLLYPFLSLETNFIDGYIPRLGLVVRYLDDLAASANVGYKTDRDEVSIEAQILHQRFPHPDMASSVSLTDRLGARTLTLATSLFIEEFRKQYRLQANALTLGYQVSFLEHLEDFRGAAVPDDIPTTGRLNSVVFGFQRDSRIPRAVSGVPVGVLAEPLAYGHALRLHVELASELLGSTRPDMQQVRWEAGQFVRLGHQTLLTLRLFGGWSAGSVPLQRKLSLAGPAAVRGYPYRLHLLGDRLLGWSTGLRFPVLRDVRVEDPWRFFGLRSLHIGPFVDGGWLWDIGDRITDVSLRLSTGLRIVFGMGFFSTLRFEMVVDIAHPLDEQGRQEGGVQTWIRLQATARGGLH
jgi:hypothetical protein